MTIDAASVEAILAFVASREGVTCREVAFAVFGEGGGSTKGATHQILRVLAALGYVESERSDQNVLTYRACHWWPTTVESIALTPRFLGLMIHILERGLEDGYIGAPSAVLLEHLKRERERIDVPARAEGTGT